MYIYIYTSLSLSLCIYIYICIYTYICMYVAKHSSQNKTKPVARRRTTASPPTSGASECCFRSTLRHTVAYYTIHYAIVYCIVYVSRLYYAMIYYYYTILYYTSPILCKPCACIFSQTRRNSPGDPRKPCETLSETQQFNDMRRRTHTHTHTCRNRLFRDPFDEHTRCSLFVCRAFAV